MDRRWQKISSLGAFTLIEMLVAITVFSIITVAVGQFLSNFLIMRFNAEALMRIRSEGNQALDFIDDQIRNGLTLPDACIGGSAPAGTIIDSLKINVPNSSGVNNQEDINFNPHHDRMAIEAYIPDPDHPEVPPNDCDPTNTPSCKRGVVAEADGTTDASYINGDVVQNRICIFAPENSGEKFFSDNNKVDIGVSDCYSTSASSCSDQDPYHGADGSAKGVFPDLKQDQKDAINPNTPDLTFERILSECNKQGKVYQVLRTNTQETTSGTYFMRTQIELKNVGITGDPKTAIVLYRRRENTARHANSTFIASPDVQEIQLTNVLYGGTFNSPFAVKNLVFFCYFDFFTNGYMVGTRFDISFQRPGLSDNSAVITETFQRLTAVRNPYPFEY